MSKNKTQGKSKGSFFRTVMTVFVISIAGLLGMTVLAVVNDSLATMITFSGIIYMLMSLAFLGIMTWAFIFGHLGGAREVEDPKFEIFGLEKVSVNEDNIEQH